MSLLMKPSMGMCKISKPIRNGRNLVEYVHFIRYNQLMEEDFNTPSPRKKPEIIEGWNKNVLLADDDKELLKMTALTLRKMGCTVETVDDGVKLLARLDNTKPGEFGLVVTDREMPGMDGAQVLAKIRADERYKNLPAILYSGNLNSEIRETVEKLGYVCLDKPSSIIKFNEAIKSALAKSVK